MINTSTHDTSTPRTSTFMTLDVDGYDLQALRVVAQAADRFASKSVLGHIGATRLNRLLAKGLAETGPTPQPGETGYRLSAAGRHLLEDVSRQARTAL